ncbi:MAG: triosephosphate isomerase, partial [Patescibacteria group bacterium]|nr:triosephosphate isomerase [Patescibacteria group bacterium]
MKPLFIIGNWKSNKLTADAQLWLEQAQQVLTKTPITDNKTVVVCVPFTLLSQVSSYVSKQQLPFAVGAQDVSPFPTGAYTGEICAKQVKEFATHVIIGHSERRKNFGETNEMLFQKTKQAADNGLTPIYLVQTFTDPVPEEATIVGYEPVGAIGTGHPDSPENANEVAKKILENNPHVSYVLYGG